MALRGSGGQGGAAETQTEALAGKLRESIHVETSRCMKDDERC